MKAIQFLLALTGLLLLVATGYFYSQNQIIVRYNGSPEVLIRLSGGPLLGDEASASVLRMPLADGLSIKNAIDSMRLRANILNVRLLNEIPLDRQVQALSGEQPPYIQIFEFCDPMMAIELFSYNDEFAAFLPCRIALFEDDKGKAWLLTFNMNQLIQGRHWLKQEHRDQAKLIWKHLQEIMRAGARGEI